MARRTVWEATPRSVRWQLHLLLALQATGCVLFESQAVGTTTCIGCETPGTKPPPTPTTLPPDTGTSGTTTTPDTGATDTGATDTGATDTGYTFTGTVSARGGLPTGLGALPKPTSRHGR